MIAGVGVCCSCGVWEFTEIFVFGKTKSSWRWCQARPVSLPVSEWEKVICRCNFRETWENLISL